MAEEIILIDTSILIDYFRKTDKANSKFISLVRRDFAFKISAITEYEIYSGSTNTQQAFWNKLLESIDVMSFDTDVVKAAITINNRLKTKRKQLAIADLFIAATAISNNLSIATLNKKHFERIDDLVLID